jgi:Tfp pilus assembly protein PilN
MRIDLNLATEPFRNRSMFWLATTAGYLVAIVALIVVAARAADVGASTVELRDELARQEKTITELESQVEQIKQDKGKTVFLPQDREALDDARRLIVRRSFSWSRLLGDLEGYVPARARLDSITIGQMTGEGSGLVVDMVIQGHGQSYAQMGEFIARLDASAGRFVAEPIQTERDEETSEFKFSVSVQYRPAIAPAPAPAPSAAAAPAQEDGDV